jgi:hypothetical protein
MANPRRPLDSNQRAKLIVDIATGESDEPKEPAEKTRPDPVISGRRGGLKGGRKGGKARAARLSPERRSELARNAARVRWSRDV